MAVLALVDAGLVLTERRISAYIGEYLIYDMRSKVFRHIQRMPLAFFTRTQTGALVSRLNNDVIGAQQAFTDLLSNVVGNFVTVVIVLGAMFFLSWKITLAALILVPLFLIPARFVGQRIGSLTKEGYNLNSEMNMVMQERFQVGGAMLVKLLGPPRRGGHRFEAKAGRVRDIGISQATYSRIFFVSLTLTARWPPPSSTASAAWPPSTATLALGTLVALTAYLTRLYGPLTQLSNVNLDVMTALVSFERLFEVLDIVPMIQEDPDAVDVPRGTGSVSFENVSFTYPSAEEVSLASLESVAVLESGARNEILHDVSFTVEPGHMVALVGPVGRRQDDDLHAGAPPLRRDEGDGAPRRRRRAPRHHGLASRRGRRRDPGPAPLPRHLAGQPRCTPVPRPPRPKSSRPWPRPRSATSSASCPTASTPSSASGATGSRAARSSGSPWPASCSRRPTSWCSTRRRRTSTPSPRRPSSVPCRETLAGRTSLVIAHRLSTVREADELLVIDDGRIVERGTHASLLAENGLYAELYRTQFADQEDEEPTADRR